MNARFTEVGAVACAGCGASLTLTALVGHTRCAHCGQQQPVPAELGERLGAYQRAVVERAATVRARLGQRELWAHRQRTGSTRMWALVLFAIVFLLLLLLGLPGAVVLGRLGIVELETSLVVMLALLGVALALSLLVAVVTWSGRSTAASAPEVRLPDVTVACSGCGGENPMSSGAVHGSCRYCAAQLVASADKVKLVLAAAASVLRTAALEKNAARRSVTAPRSQLPLLRRSEAYYQSVQQAAYGGAEAQAVAHWFHSLAAALGGRLLRGDELCDWLDANWAGVYLGVDQFWSHPRFAVALERVGYPLLIDRAPATQQSPARLCVLLATAEHDGAAHSSPELTALGLELEASEAGLVAWVNAELSARVLAAAPEPRWLQVAVDGLVVHAQSVGLEPPAVASLVASAA